MQQAPGAGQHSRATKDCLDGQAKKAQMPDGKKKRHADVEPLHLENRLSRVTPRSQVCNLDLIPPLDNSTACLFKNRWKKRVSCLYVCESSWHWV